MSTDGFGSHPKDTPEYREQRYQDWAAGRDHGGGPLGLKCEHFLKDAANDSADADAAEESDAAADDVDEF